MNNFILYLLESGISLLVFFLFYQMFLKRETYYQLNRIFLLGSLVFSLVVPLLNISLSGPSTGQITSFQMEPILVSATQGAIVTTKRIGIFEVIGAAYLLMVILLTVRLLLNFRRITNLFSEGKVLPFNNYKLILHSMNYPPFSFFRNIFISDQHYNEKEIDDIIEHEKAHVRQLHSFDLVIAEFLIILQWFNPMVWYFKNMITENHEFLADKAVINRGFSPESYRLRILTQLFGIRSMPAVHNFNKSVTQKRLTMMEKSKSPAVSRLKIILVLPAAILLFYVFACSSGPTEITGQEIPEVGEKMEVWYKVDEPAEPEGGVMAFRKHIATNVIYPEQAKKNGVQGKVFVQFIIDETGKLVTAIESKDIPPPPPPKTKEGSAESPSEAPEPEKVVMEGVVVVGYKPPKGVETEYANEDVQLLADEAVRVIIESDLKWKPAMRDGKPVKCAWTMPINFVLQ